MAKAFLITGATGKQGSAVLQALLDHSSFSAEVDTIYALTRDPASPIATALAAKSSAIKVIAGDLNQVSAIFDSLPSKPWGVYAVGVAGSLEVQQGKDLVDASIQAGVSHFVYSSVDRGGAASDDRPTNVPHFKTKYEIEKHLKAAIASASGRMGYTILRPVFFLENLEQGFIGRVIAAAWREHLPGPMQVIATADIGFFGANAFFNSSSPDYHNVAISIAGDELTFDEANAIFKKQVGYDIPTSFGFIARGLVAMVKNIRLMFKYLKEEGGTAVDIDRVRALNPGLRNMSAWLAESRFATNRQ